MTKVATVVSARSGSRRLPRKALKELGGVPMIEFLLRRLRGTRLGGQVIFATTERGDDDELSDLVRGLDVAVVRGADADVVARYLAVARQFGLDWIVRVTGDCPFVDAASLDHCLATWDPKEPFDLISTKGIFPVGIDYELFSVATMEREWPKMDVAEREHLTLRLYQPEHGFAVDRFVKPATWPGVTGVFTVDTQADYDRAVGWVNRLGNRTFSVQELLQLSLVHGG